MQDSPRDPGQGSSPPPLHSTCREESCSKYLAVLSPSPTCPWLVPLQDSWPCPAPCFLKSREVRKRTQVLPDLEPPALGCGRWSPPLRLPLGPFPRLPIPRWETTRMGQGEGSRPTLLSLSLSLSVQLDLLLHQGVGIRPALPCYESHYS